jgi:hypothetical protein
MFRLYEAGKSPSEIASLCEEGTAGVASFTIPRRTVQEIVSKMAAEADRKLPTSVAEMESAEAVERFPVRMAAILDAEIERLATKQKRGKLTLDDLDFLAKAATVSTTLHKRLSRGQPAGARGSRPARQAAGSQQGPGSALEQLAQREAVRAGDEEQPSLAHTCQEPTNPDASAQPHRPDRVGQTSPVERRAAAAEQARTALPA